MPRYIDTEKTDSVIKDELGVYDTTDLKEMLKLFPTEDVAPVVHAHWIKNKGYMLSRCSACQNTIPLGREYKHKYCPNCGAKMGKEETQDATL